MENVQEFQKKLETGLDVVRDVESGRLNKEVTIHVSGKKVETKRIFFDGGDYILCELKSERWRRIKISNIQKISSRFEIDFKK
ncbi:hypothetical protein GFV16_00125 [Bacillus megaterium]|uniref:hypothetical protein n=1 Tax=Priestia megaterium TaxID=1404 RepID=UPI001293F0F0|nr:hypothetical protein [Priestia megaterium]MQR84350.1 hypothetical protein [Priestia megaterium]